jgi:hypothetical protein
MKLKYLLVVPMLALVTFVLAQGAPVQEKQDAKTSLDAIKANVAKITEAGEKQRWQANIDLWQLKFAQPGIIAKTDLDKMTSSLDRIKANVAKVTDAQEKERWQANIDMWQVLIDQKGVLLKGGVEKVKAPFEKMKANIAKITEAGEKQRWEANRDLWQGVIDRAMAGAVIK